MSVPFQRWLAPGPALNLALDVALTGELAPQLERPHAVRGVPVDAAPVSLELDDASRLAVATALVVRVDGNPGLVFGAGPETSS